jgi:hypothetical protein
LADIFEELSEKEIDGLSSRLSTGSQGLFKLVDTGLRIEPQHNSETILESRSDLPWIF